MDTLKFLIPVGVRLYENRIFSCRIWGSRSNENFINGFMLSDFYSRIKIIGYENTMLVNY